MNTGFCTGNSSHLTYILILIWLRDTTNSTNVCIVYGYGYALNGGAPSIGQHVNINTSVDRVIRPGKMHIQVFKHDVF